MKKELTESGAQQALYTALAAAIRAHESPHVAVTAALAAVEHELVMLLNTPTELLEWLDAYQDMHERLTKYLHAQFDEPQ